MGYTMCHNRQKTSNSNREIKSIGKKKKRTTHNIIYKNLNIANRMSMQIAFPYYPIEAPYLMSCLASKNLWKWKHIGEILLSNFFKEQCEWIVMQEQCESDCQGQTYTIVFARYIPCFAVTFQWGLNSTSVLVCLFFINVNPIWPFILPFIYPVNHPHSRLCIRMYTHTIKCT